MRFSVCKIRKSGYYGGVSCQLGIVLAFALSLGLLTGCGSKAVTQTNETGHFSIAMSLDAAALGQRSIDLHIRDKAGADTDVEEMIVAPVMREMGMASPEMRAQRIAVGQYRVTGEPFSMTGIWELDVRVVFQGQEETSIFKVEVR